MIRTVIYVYEIEGIICEDCILVYVFQYQRIDRFSVVKRV